MAAEEPDQPQDAGDAPELEPDPAGEDADRRLMRELSARGVPADEVERLIALGRKEKTPQTAAKPVPNVPTAPVLEDEQFVPRPMLVLPEPREATAEQVAEAGSALGRASLALRRGAIDEALTLCRQAIDLTPADPVALGLYGDVLQSLGRVDDALLCYQSAVTIAPARQSAERRYAELRLLQERSIAWLQDEAIPRSPLVAVLMSALLPGAGQLYNGEPLKGLCVALGALLFVVVLGWTPYGFRHGLTSITPSLALFSVLAATLYIYAVIDASVGATRGNRPRHKTGWEV